MRVRGAEQGGAGGPLPQPHEPEAPGELPVLHHDRRGPLPGHPPRTGAQPQQQALVVVHALGVDGGGQLGDHG